MRKFITLLVFGFLLNGVNAQTNAETGNIVYTTVNPPPSGSPHTWSGFTVQNTAGGGVSGGNTPAYNPNTGTFLFGYTQRTVTYTNAINFALTNAGTGIQVSGFKYSWEYFNQDYSRGTLTGNISLTNSSGSVIQNYGYNMPKTTSGWTTMSGTQNFNTQYELATLGNLNVSFTGKDDRFWAGYYGPQIRAIDVRMLYTVPPPPVPEFSRWVKLTDENGTFTLTKPGTVRYGAEGTYIYQTYEPGTYSCSNGAWGKDPLGGVYKACDLGSNTSPPSPLPTTNTTTATTTVTNSIIAAAAEPAPPTTTTTTTATNTVVDSSPPTTNLVSATTSPTNSSSSNSQTTSSTSTTASATTTAAVSTPSSNNTRSVDGTSIGLSVVARNQQREQAIAMQASQAAIQIANEASAQTQQEAVNVASQSSANSMAMAQSGPKTSTNMSEVKTASTNTDLTFQSNQSSTSLSLFAAPSVVNTQKQTESQQTFTATNTLVVQSTRTNQTNQQTESVTVFDRTNNIGALNITTSIVDTQSRPPTFNPQVMSSVTSTVSNVPTEIVSQQTQTYSLLPPAVSVTTQSATTQSYKLVQEKEVLVNEKDKVQETTYTPVVANYSLLPPRQETPQTNVQPVVSTVTQTNTFNPIISSQPVVQMTNDFSMSDSQKMLLDRSSPVFQTLENKSIETQSNMVSQQGPTVNRNAQNNEAAGNVDITRLAVAPAGYGDYLNLTLKDAAFYAPKEVYANQRTVDNVRALRQLASDRLHQQMVNSQYERK